MMQKHGSEAQPLQSLMVNSRELAGPGRYKVDPKVRRILKVDIDSRAVRKPASKRKTPASLIAPPVRSESLVRPNAFTRKGVVMSWCVGDASGKRERLIDAYLFQCFGGDISRRASNLDVHPQSIRRLIQDVHRGAGSERRYSLAGR
jgi:hypothetical protein